MKYIITMTDREGVWDGLSQSRQQEVLQQHAQYRQALEDSGNFLYALHLYPRDEAITIRLDESGTISREDGPYHTQPEYMGGCYVIEADSMEEAVAWAERGRFIPGANEVRQIWD